MTAKRRSDLFATVCVVGISACGVVLAQGFDPGCLNARLQEFKDQTTKLRELKTPEGANLRRGADELRQLRREGAIFMQRSSAVLQPILEEARHHTKVGQAYTQLKEQERKLDPKDIRAVRAMQAAHKKYHSVHDDAETRLYTTDPRMDKINAEGNQRQVNSDDKERDFFVKHRTIEVPPGERQTVTETTVIATAAKLFQKTIPESDRALSQALA